MMTKNKVLELLNKFNMLFKKEPLPQDTIFKEKPSLFLVLLVYLIGIVALFLVREIENKIISGLIIQLVNFFKGVKLEWVKGFFSKLVTLSYIIIVFLVFIYHLKRQLTCYVLNNEEIIIKKGLFVRKEIYLPLTRIRNISLNISLFGLIFKYGTILIDTGGFTGMIPLSNMSSPRKRVTQILEKLDRKVILEENK